YSFLTNTATILLYTLSLHDALPISTGATVQTSGKGPFDIVQAFVYTKAEVNKLAQQAVQALKQGGMLWFSYPKKTSKIKTDISRDRKSTRLNSSHDQISYAVFCLKK